MIIIDATPRYRRITLRGIDGKRHTYTGMVHATPTGKIRGTRRDDVKGGVSLNVLYCDPADVVKVEREDPVYGTWTTRPFTQTQ